MDLNVARPKNLYSTLKMFNYSTIFLDLEIYCDKTFIGKSPIIRKIKYDRWNDLYLIENSYLYGDIRFKDFDSMFSEIYKFKKIEIAADNNLNGYKNKEFSINYDFYLNSMEFLPPFKIIEYNREFDNIKIKNKSCKLYVK